MEALILILVEAMSALVAPFAAVIGALLGGAISSVFTLISDLVLLLYSGRRSIPKVDPSNVPAKKTIIAAETVGEKSSLPPKKKRGSRRWTRWLLIGSASVTALIFAGLLVINQWFLSDIAHWLLERQRERSGISITAKTIDGNLFTGQFAASGIVVKRENHPAGLIDLSVDRVTASVPVWRVFSSIITVDAITVDGINGKFERGTAGQAPAEKSKDAGALSFEDDGKQKTLTVNLSPKKRRGFQVTALSISKVNVIYADHTRKHPLSVPVTIEKLTANPLRSRWAIFDVLFRTNASGTIAGRPFNLTTTGDDLGRSTTWTADGLPVALLASQIGGPFTLLSDGTCDVRVTDHWQMSQDQRIIVMDWSLVLNHVTAAVPESTSKTMALLAKPVVAFINAKGDRVPLSFTVTIDEDRFDNTASVEAAGLWTVVSDSLAATFGKKLGIETDTVKDLEEKAIDKAKDVLEKWRKKKSD